MSTDNFTKFHDLWALIGGDADARRYFNALPDYVKAQAGTRAQNINSLASLKDYAENLTRGDR